MIHKVFLTSGHYNSSKAYNILWPIHFALFKSTKMGNYEYMSLFSSTVEKQN